MITVKIEEDVALDMLMDRLSFWTDDTTTTELFEQMYQEYLDERMFDGDNFDVMDIVDNDYVNWCAVVEEGDDLYDECKKVWENNERDLETVNATVEAGIGTAYLIRY